MSELTIGSRFWHKDKLCEVVEFESAFKCVACKIYGDRRMCEKTNCLPIAGTTESLFVLWRLRND